MTARRLTVGRASHAQTDLSRSVVCHDLSRSGHLSQSWGTPLLIGARPPMVRRGHPCARGARRAPHGPRARAPRSARRPFLVQRRASAPRPPAPRLRRTRRTRVLLPGPLSQGWWGCQGTRSRRVRPVIVRASAVGLRLKAHGRRRTLKGLARDSCDGRAPDG